MPASAASRVGRLHGFRVAQRNGQDRGVGGEPMHDLGQRVMSLGEIAKLHVKLFSLGATQKASFPPQAPVKQTSREYLRAQLSL